MLCEVSEGKCHLTAGNRRGGGGDEKEEEEEDEDDDDDDDNDIFFSVALVGELEVEAEKEKKSPHNMLTYSIMICPSSHQKTCAEAWQDSVPLWVGSTCTCRRRPVCGN